MGELFGRDKPRIDLAWTGERLTDGAGMQVELEHLHRYFLARELARGLDVLDIAAGEGYGAALLAQTARTVVGIDSDTETIAHAARAYALPNLRFATGDARHLPLGDDSIDLVVSFETIEHLAEQDEMVGEIRRVLRPDGRLLVSTPERNTYSPQGTAANPFHVRELTREEFAALLGRHFEHVSIVGQRPLLGSAIFPETVNAAGLLTFERRGEDRFEASTGLPRAVYLMALASAREIGTLPGSLYIESGSVEASVAAAIRADADRNAADLDAERQLARTEIDRISRQAEADRSASEAELRGIVQRHRSTQDATENHLRALLARIEDLGAKVDGLGETQARTARHRDFSKGEQDALEQRLVLLESHAGHTEREYANAVRALKEAEEYARHLEREVEAERARGDRLGLHLGTVLSSRLWLGTAPLRRLGLASPFLRRFLHGLSAALPWVRAEPLPSLPSPGLAEPTPTGPASQEPPIAEDPDDPGGIKAALSERLSADLAAFFAGDDRIVFRGAHGNDTPSVSVLIVLWNKAHFTLRCLRSLASVEDEGPLEIIVVDNASSDDTLRLLERVDGARIVRNPTNAGFLLATNQAAGMARGESLLLLNNDAFPRPGAIRSALETLRSEPDIGAVGGLIILPSGLVQEAGSMVWSDGSTYGYGRGYSPDSGEVRFRRDVSYVSGAFLLTPRDRWEALGGFDQGFAPAYYEDTDYCMRLRQQGLRVVFEPRAVVDHYELGSQAKSGDAVEATLRNRGAFRERHAPALATLPPPVLDNPLRARDEIAGRSRRLLIVDDLVPLPANGSGMPRLQAMIAAAVADGWSVTCYSMQDPDVDWEAIWRALPPGVEVIANRGAANLGNFLVERAGHYAAILVSRPHNMPLFWAAAGSHPGAIGKARVVYDAEAIFAARRIARIALEGVAVDRETADTMIAEEVANIAAGVRAVTCVTAGDREVFRRLLPPGIPVYRVGHAVKVSADTPPHAARHGFLFIGRLLERDAPNWQGLAWFVEEVWPSIRQALPDAEITVVGRLNPSHEALAVPGVRLAGPLDDLRDAYDRARVFVAPVRFAAGVPIKIIEATAAGLPTACTTLMARQLAWPSGQALAASDDAAELARLAVALHEDGDAWQAMVDHARRYLARDFGPDDFAASLSAALGGQIAPGATTDAKDRHRLSRIEAVWGAPPPEGDAAMWARFPTTHPIVAAEICRRAGGSPYRSVLATLRDRLQAEGYELPLPRAASLCSGDGAQDVQLLAEGIVRHCIGYDLAAAAIDRARSAASKRGLSAALEYRVSDLETSDLGETGLDLVLSHHAIHHIRNLEFVLDNVHNALRPRGIFHLNEYVGPDRFQWTDRQVQEMNDWLASLPEKYRHMPDGRIKHVTGRPTLAEMIADDPTEAVRSSAIVPLLAERFEILAHHRVGGTLTMMALADIAHNFDPAVEEDVAHLRRLLDRERMLIDAGDIGSDFVVITARRGD